jgi:hypothetical protein
MNANTAHPFKFGAKVARMRSLPRSPATDRAYGLAVLAAVNRDNLNRLHKGMAQSWRNRSDKQVKLAYEATMRGEDIGLVELIRIR